MGQVSGSSGSLVPKAELCSLGGGRVSGFHCTPPDISEVLIRGGMQPFLSIGVLEKTARGKKKKHKTNIVMAKWPSF